jgi:serine/threonine protein kinase
MSKPSRVCPLCETTMEIMSCAACNVPSVEIAMMDEGDETLTEGMIIADRYRIEKVLGRGAMGSVYEAIQLSVDRRVAIKTLQKKLLNEYRLVQRFYREARAASQLDHPNVVQTYDFGIDPETNVPYIAMEYLDGYELTDLIDERHALPEEETCAILGQVAAGLVEAHEKGVIHRDLKPQNIRVRVLSDGDLQAKVLDFGIAKVVRGPEDSDTLTGTGMTVGTPPYMSPEQILGEGVDARADLYSLGCILHECLTGRLPFWADDRLSIVTMHLTGKRPELPEYLSNAQPPTEALRHLHRVLLARHKTERPPNARVVAKILKKLAVGKQVDVEKALSTAATHVSEAPVEKRRSDRNVALLSGRTDENLKTSTAPVTEDPLVIADAPTLASMSVSDLEVSSPLLTGPEIPADTSVDVDNFDPPHEPKPSWETGNRLVVLSAVIAVVVAIALLVTLGTRDGNDSNNEAASTVISEEKQAGTVPRDVISFCGEKFDRQTTAIKCTPQHSSSVQDADLKAITELTNLTELDLTNTKITDAGLQQLKVLTTLERLGLAKTNISDKGLENLQGLNQLKALYLDGTAVSDEGLQHIKNLKGLNELDLDGTSVTDEGLKLVGGLTQLWELDLANTKVTNAGLKHLQGLTQLRELDLESTEVTDAGLRHLYGLETLGKITLAMTRAKPAKPDALATNIQLVTKPPGVRVEISGEFLGTTPLDIPFKAGMGKRLLRLSAKNYKTKEVILERTEKSPKSVTLESTRIGTPKNRRTPVRAKSKRRPLKKSKKTGFMERW